MSFSHRENSSLRSFLKQKQTKTELAACEEAASIPRTLAPALEAAAALRVRVRRASRSLRRASERTARVEAAVAEIRERRRRRQQQGGGGGETRGDDEGESDDSSLFPS